MRPLRSALVPATARSPRGRSVMRVPRSLALGLLLVLIVPGLALGALAPSASALVTSPATSAPASIGPVTTKVTPYYGGQSLTWSAFDQLGALGGYPDGATRLTGVSGGSMGIVVTGSDLVSNEAASWVSKDG